MDTDTETLLQDILARCAAEAAACLAKGSGKDHYPRSLEMRLATDLARTSARLADSIARLQKNSAKRGSNRTK